MPDWDADSPKLDANLRRAFESARDLARDRAVPDADFTRLWQRLTMAGLAVPNPNWVGAFRGEADLVGVEVSVGAAPGVNSRLVAAEVADFLARLSAAMADLDSRIPRRSLPKDADELEAVIELCAFAHAEWVRIHPFANGNGRTARLWAAHIAMRYGIPPFVRLRPRPNDGYAPACTAAMAGQWQQTIPVFRRMFNDLLR